MGKRTAMALLTFIARRVRSPERATIHRNRRVAAVGIRESCASGIATHASRVALAGTLSRHSWRHLRDPDLLLLNIAAPTGSYWACAPSCGVHTFGAHEQSGTIGLSVATEPDADGYHGVVHLPAFDASPPAIEAGSALDD